MVHSAWYERVASYCQCSFFNLVELFLTWRLEAESKEIVRYLELYDAQKNPHIVRPYSSCHRKWLDWFYVLFVNGPHGLNVGRDLTFPSVCWWSLIDYILHYRHYIYRHIRTHTHTHIRAYISIYVRILVYIIHIRTHISTHAYMCMQLHAYTYIYTYNHVYAYISWYSACARIYECIFRSTKLCLGWSRPCAVVHVVVIWSTLNVGPCCRKQRRWREDRWCGFGEAGCFLIGALHHRWKWNHDFLGSLRWYQALRKVWKKTSVVMCYDIWTWTHVGKIGQDVQQTRWHM